MAPALGAGKTLVRIQQSGPAFGVDMKDLAERLLSLCLLLDRPISKCDLKRDNSLPSYSSLLRLGIGLSEINDTFRKLQLTKECLFCKNTFYAKTKDYKFCGHSCSASYNNPRKASKFKDCDSCGKKLSRGGTSLCHPCSTTRERRKRAEDWRNGTLVVTDPRVTRNLFLEFVDYKCNNCCLTSWNNRPITLDLDHVDGDYTNNTFANLRFLCPNCHSQTDTYKAKNYGFGRHSRKQRYSDGKSY